MLWPSAQKFVYVTISSCFSALMYSITYNLQSSYRCNSNNISIFRYSKNVTLNSKYTKDSLPTSHAASSSRQFTFSNRKLSKNTKKALLNTNVLSCNNIASEGSITTYQSYGKMFLTPIIVLLQNKSTNFDTSKWFWNTWALCTDTINIREAKLLL